MISKSLSRVIPDLLIGNPAGASKHLILIKPVISPIDTFEDDKKTDQGKK